MVVPQLAEYTDLALFLFRTVLALVFVSSGWSHATEPESRGESIGMSPGTTRALGIVQVAAGAAVIAGVYVQIAAGVLAVVMVGALYKKVFVWGKGFWGTGGGDGWWYELLYVTGLLVVVTTGGGSWTLL